MDLNMSRHIDFGDAQHKRSESAIVHVNNLCLMPIVGCTVAGDKHGNKDGSDGQDGSEDNALVRRKRTARASARKAVAYQQVSVVVFLHVFCTVTGL